MKKLFLFMILCLAVVSLNAKPLAFDELEAELNNKLKSKVQQSAPKNMDEAVHKAYVVSEAYERLRIFVGFDSTGKKTERQIKKGINYAAAVEQSKKVEELYKDFLDYCELNDIKVSSAIVWGLDTSSHAVPDPLLEKYDYKELGLLSQVIDGQISLGDMLRQNANLTGKPGVVNALLTGSPVRNGYFSAYWIFSSWEGCADAIEGAGDIVKKKPSDFCNIK